MKGCVLSANLMGELYLTFGAQKNIALRHKIKFGGKNSMKKMLLVAMLVGMLLIGAASAFMQPSLGTAKANADAYTKAKATIDLDPWTNAEIKTIWTNAGANTWTFANAKLDPVSESVSNGWAVSTIAGKLTENNWCGPKQTIVVDMLQAASTATAFNYAEGSKIADGSTFTANIATTSMSDDKISSLSIADSSSSGFAMGIPGTPITAPLALPALPTLPA